MARRQRARGLDTTLLMEQLERPAPGRHARSRVAADAPRMPYPAPRMPSYSDQRVPYPGQGMPYPDQGMPYPDQGMPYPDPGMPYPDQGMPYPDQGMPYPGPGRASAGPRRPRRSAWTAAALAGILVAGVGMAVVLRAQTTPPARTGAATFIPATVGNTPPAAPARAARAMRPSQPVRILIPSLRIDAPVMLLGLSADGSLQVPPLDNHNLAGWYDHSVMPGEAGTSVILGHVDSFTGPSVFFSIKYLRPGQRITVIRANGSRATFAVDGVQKVAKVTFPGQEIYGNTSYPGLRLITCGGPFNAETRQYVDNIVVYAHLV